VMAGFHVDKWNSGKGLWPNSSSSCQSAVRKEYKVKFHSTRSNGHVMHILVMSRIALHRVRLGVRVSYVDDFVKDLKC